MRVNDDNVHASRLADLVETARAHLRETVLPAVPEHARYDALMVANAMAIAGREIEHGEAVARRIAAAIGDFYRAAGQARADGPAEAAHGPAEAALAADLRDGRFDGDAQAPALHALLVRITRERLTISNPKRLDPEA